MRTMRMMVAVVALAWAGAAAAWGIVYPVGISGNWRIVVGRLCESVKSPQNRRFVEAAYSPKPVTGGASVNFDNRLPDKCKSGGLTAASLPAGSQQAVTAQVANGQPDTSSPATP